jgi:trehalose/maltose hydrolase-like predicted phosphorylase
MTLGKGQATLGQVKGFTLSYDGFDPAHEGLREALTSTGNGYICARGAAEWEEAGDVHSAGTYAHGVYNRETTMMGGQPVPNEDLVALPNWLLLQLRIDGEGLLRLEDVELLSYRHGYDIRHAVVWRDVRFRDRAGREISVRTRRFVSMARMHQAGIAWDLTAENWSGGVELVSAIDGRVTNHGVARYRQLEGRHLDPVAARVIGPDVISLKARTRQSSLEVAEAARTRVYRQGEELEVARSDYQTDDYIQQVLAFDLSMGEPVRIEKMVSLYTSRDRAIDEPLTNAGKSVARYLTFDEALGEHERTWDGLWRICDVRFPADEHVQFVLRFHAAHLLQVCSPFTAHHDAGVPARGLNGEAYRGHVFWDELYVYPFLNFRLPEVTRELLMYRYRRLGEARSAAIEAGHRGAMYPWQSGSDGREETQVTHLNPLSNRWEPDGSHLQRHVNAAIFYNVWHYCQATENIHFLRDYGAEMMLQIARFWASVAHYNRDRERWEIHGVMGPDEFHTKSPDAPEPGLRNNAYTNVMVAWICETAQQVLNMLPASRSKALRMKLSLTDDEIRTWRDMSRGMFVPFHGDGIISQFEGYEQLEELDWDLYRARHGNIQRLDRILRAEGDDPNRYKVTKQSDTLMLFFLFPEAELRRLFEQLGYPYDSDTARRNVEYYTERTSNGSTLSFVTNAGVLAPIDAERSWGSFRMALESDLEDVQGGTTREGIHMGVMSGTLDLIQRAYLGTEIRDDVLRFAPRLLDRLEGLAFPMQFRGTYLGVTVEGGRLTVTADPEGFSPPIKVSVGNEVRELGAGETASFALHPGAAVASGS